MYSIPKKQIQVIQKVEPIKSARIPKQRVLVLVISAIVLTTGAALFFINSNSKAVGNVAGESTKSKALFEELRAYPEYSKMYSELVRNKVYKRMENNNFTIVVISNENLGNSTVNMDEYVLYQEFNSSNQRLVSLSNANVQMTIDGFGKKKLNDREVINEYKFNSGTIIEISKKY